MDEYLSEEFPPKCRAARDTNVKFVNSHTRAIATCVVMKLFVSLSICALSTGPHQLLIPRADTGQRVYSCHFCSNRYFRAYSTEMQAESQLTYTELGMPPVDTRNRVRAEPIDHCRNPNLVVKRGTLVTRVLSRREDAFIT